MAAATIQPLTANQQTKFLAYYKGIQNTISPGMAIKRARLTKVDKAYQREEAESYDSKQAKIANDAGDNTKFQDITVPVVMPQVEAAVVYQTSVFLTGYPLFGAVADPKYADEAVQMESLITDQSLRGAWARELMLFFRDGAKFNESYLCVAWDREVTSTITTAVSSPTKTELKEVVWSGNTVLRLDPYNTFVDDRVAPAESYKKGEYSGFTEYMSKIALKSFLVELPDTIVGNITSAFESSCESSAKDAANGTSFFIPHINAKADRDSAYGRGTDWMSWAGMASDSTSGIKYKGGYEVTTLYCKVLPSEMGIKGSNRNTPQIYKLIIVNHKHIVYAEKQTNAHAYLPILVGQPNEDGLGKQTKSLAENAEPFQAVSTTYMSSIIASRRRAISDRALFDPSRVSAAHINNPNPSAKIPVRPAAYGKPLQDSVYQFPFREDQASNSMQQIQTLIGMSNSLSGQNQASQGQFVKGNKTLKEFDSVMDNANGRDQMASILYEHQVFVPLKHILKLNILQFQGGTTVYNRDRSTAIEIDPVKLRKAVVEFKLTDGLVPASKVISAETLSVAFQTIATSSELQQGYNIPQLFSYLMKTQGAAIADFEKSAEQITYEQAASQWGKLAELAIQNGQEFKVEQPKPQDFNYNPQSQKPTPEETTRS